MDIRKICVQIMLAEIIATLILVIIYVIEYERQIYETPKEETMFKHHDSIWNKRILTNVVQFKGGRVLSAENLENINILNVNQCKSRRFLVYKCDIGSRCGGLGDRQKGIVSTFLLSLLTNRTFIIDMTRPCKLEKFLQPSVYNWTICSEYIKRLPKNNVLLLNLMYKDKQFRKTIHNFDFDSNSNWTAKVVVVRINAYVDIIDKIRRHNYTNSRLKWLIHTTNEETIHRIMHTLFKPSKSMIDEAMNLYNHKIQNKHLVCCHIRKGKNPTVPRDNILKLGSPNETKIIEFLKPYDRSRKYVIYVSTDSDAVRQYAYTKIKSCININRRIVHVDRLMNESKTEACEGLYTAIFEQFILSLCDTLVLTRSNFGTNAAYMRGVSDNIFLYHPNTGIVGKYNLTDIQRIFIMI